MRARLLLTAIMGGMSVTASLAAASDAPIEEPSSITHHRLTLGGRLLDYTAEAGRIAIRDVETGTPQAHMFYVAYRVPRPVNTPPRPIIFLWNGGPGVPSSTLHFEFVGPQRIDGDRLVANADTLLKSADLVIVDMVGTGFSRLTDRANADAFYGTLADARAFTEFVRTWRITHGAGAAPFYLMGESFGSARGGMVANLLEQRGIKVAGLVLISGGLGLPDTVPREQAAALHIVDLAATARALGKGFGDASIIEKWARDTYAPALAQASRLSESDRDAVIAQLSRYSGMLAAGIDRATLRFTPRAYREALNPGGPPRNQYDMRLVAEPAIPDALGVAFIRGPLGYATSLPYIGVEPIETGFAPSGSYPDSVNERWNWATKPMTAEEVAAEYKRAQAAGDGPPRLGPPPPGTAEAMRANPALRVLIATGLYDSYSSCAANRELVRRLPPDLAGRVTFRCYPGGHMMYRDAEARRDLAHDIATLVAGGK